MGRVLAIASSSHALGIKGGTIAHKADKHQKESAWNTEFYVQLLHFIIIYDTQESSYKS